MNRIDHLLYAAPDLELAIDALERRLGVRATPGGRHPVWGTHNALIALGPDRYLEILAPDPAAAPVDGPKPVGLDHLAEPRVATWAARGADLERIVDQGRRAGVDLGALATGSRERVDGTTLRWTLTDPLAPRLEGVVPFFIDWGETRHPAGDAPTGCELVELIVTHPDAEHVRRVFDALELEAEVERAPRAGLRATVRSPAGIVVLT